MQFQFLAVTGPDVPPALLEFGPGLNVVHGGSNTGKSYVLRMFDFLLGASSPPEPISEQALYDFAHLGIILDDGTRKTIIRALQGGEVRVVDGHVRERDQVSKGLVLSPKHGAKNSLSKYLLGSLGVEGSRIRIDAKGSTRDLSFRDICRLVLINEAKIQEPISPIWSGQYLSKTAETSAFKFLLSGVDDSALDSAKPDASLPLRRAAQLELIDRHIRDLDQQISESDQDQDELSKINSLLDEELSAQFQLQEANEQNYRELTSRRRSLRRDLENIQDRIGEIDSLVARFELLAKHYRSDIQRLEAIREGGSLFLVEESVACPVCGAPPGNHVPSEACEGDVAAVVESASAEVDEISQRDAELGQTIKQLLEERALLLDEVPHINATLGTLDVEIGREAPSVQAVRAETKRVISQKIQVTSGLALVRRKEVLMAERTELDVSPGFDSSAIVAQQQIDGGLLDSFCRDVESELRSWEFPSAERVFFELPKMDISVSGKSKAANGKGVRALLNGAFCVSFMKHCRLRERPHPGFLVLDSLFITYKDPSDSKDAEIAATPLKDRAFRSFADIDPSLQLIILENVDVPDWLEGSENCTHFTGQPGAGRAGFFPS